MILNGLSFRHAEALYVNHNVEEVTSWSLQIHARDNTSTTPYLYAVVVPVQESVLVLRRLLLFVYTHVRDGRGWSGEVSRHAIALVEHPNANPDSRKYGYVEILC